MQRDAPALLEDIRRAVELIVQFTADRSITEYMTDVMLRAAVEREFTIIGEALHHLEKLDSVIVGQISDYRKIIGFRNVLVHGYEAIDDAIVWMTIEKDLPRLGKEITKLLALCAPP